MKSEDYNRRIAQEKQRQMELRAAAFRAARAQRKREEEEAAKQQASA